MSFKVPLPVIASAAILVGSYTVALLIPLLIPSCASAEEVLVNDANHTAVWGKTAPQVCNSQLAKSVPMSNIKCDTFDEGINKPIEVGFGYYPEVELGTITINPHTKLVTKISY